MSVSWTPKQLEAIDIKGKNILVAAAAGSGKTAVLVERIIRMISDTENPVSVDRLLVLTFTDAAATEMKRKIADAIDKKLEESPNDVWLKEQAVKVNSACISTIHSFCRRIITNNSHLTNLPSDFSLIDETENKILEERAIDAVMESYYSRIDKKDGFRSLVMGWSEVKGDNNLREIVSNLHNLSRSFSNP
ncbi:MAG: UvrD-helicase domain-containing protein, partial [Monoglobaceae bacterium]